MFRVMFFLSFLACSLVSSQAFAKEAGVLADFNQGELKNSVGSEFEVWLKGDGSDETQGCAVSLSDDDALGDESGKSLKIDYDVDSPNPAYNGVRTTLTGFDASGYDTLNMYLKGDSPKLKVEMIGAKGRPSPFIINDITGEWQKVSIPLDNFFVVKDWSAVEKFVIVFADITNEPKQGVMYIDQIHFSKEA